MSGFSDWRHSARSGLAKSKAPSKKFKSGNFFWRDRIKLEKEPVTLIFMPAEYPDYSDSTNKVLFYEWPKHTVSRGDDYFRTFACAAQGGKEDCVGCHLQYNKKDKGLVLRSVYHFSVVIMEWFYKIPVLDDSGRPVLSKKGDPVVNLGQPSTSKQKLEWNSKYDKVYGKRAYLELGKGHLSHILDIADQVGLRCGCGGNLETVSYNCGVCEHVLVDMNTTEMDAKEVFSLVTAPVRCGECSYIDLPSPQCSCDKCYEPRPITLTEVAITLSKVGDGTSSAIVSKATVPLADFNIPLNNQPAYQGDKWNDAIVPLLQQYDFAAMFKNELDHDTQSDMCQIPNPMTPKSEEFRARSRFT